MRTTGPGTAAPPPGATARNPFSTHDQPGLRAGGDRGRERRRGTPAAGVTPIVATTMRPSGRTPGTPAMPGARPGSQGRRLAGRLTSRTPRLGVDVVAAPRDSGAVAGLAAWLARIAPRQAKGTLTVAIVPDARVRTLNRDFRGHDRVTDVLSFPAGVSEVEPPARIRGESAQRPAGPELGDIVIARGTAARQARAHAHPLRAEVRILALHGLLHLLGFDHETDRGEMARAERRLRQRGGLGAGLIERDSPR